ncbi:protein BCCIP homolog isoform X3 [Diospyros lotus]|uniref:protein BCCIP homolog isoform X3 n=1 Tax=Diospyros lotus TaxID=55363 RepID=UPI00225B28C3|nr:protein BCCIP homolog isoform X3 [Diospyros lotus]
MPVLQFLQPSLQLWTSEQFSWFRTSHFCSLSRTLNSVHAFKLPQIPKMLPKSRPRQVFKPHPSIFSPFCRSIARLASAYKVKRQIQNRKFHQKSSPSSSGGKVNHKVGMDKREPYGSSDEEEFEGTIQADFAFFDPKSDDFHGVKGLLMTYLDHREWDISGFADLILSQTTVGTIVKTEEEDTPYSVVTALNLGRYKDHKCIKELTDFLLKVCKDKDILGNLRSFFKEQMQSVGLLVSQRVVNLPPQLLPPLYDALFDEISWATEDERTEELRRSFCLKHYLLLTRIYEQKAAVRRLQYLLRQRMKSFTSSVPGPLSSHCALSNLQTKS